MAQKIGKVISLSIEANTSPCAHICRYCSIGDRGPKFPINRWTAFVERFLDWHQMNGPKSVRVQGGFVGPSYNFDLETFSALNLWYKRVMGFGLTWIPLGGLKMRSEPEIRRWLQDRQAVGVEGVGASFVGFGAVHDRWNGREGDFDFLIRSLNIAVDLGMKHGANLYLTKSSLPLMAELVKILDTIPTPPDRRQVRPFYYIGHGAHQDFENITEADRDRIPDVALEFLWKGFFLRSEREWIEFIRDEEEKPEDMRLLLELTAENFDLLDTTPCDQIFADLTSRARASLSAFPSFHELAESYGDRNGTKIYMSVYDIRRLWIDRFLDKNPRNLDRSLVHYHLGRSSNPPPLWDLQ